MKRRLVAAMISVLTMLSVTSGSVEVAQAAQNTAQTNVRNTILTQTKGKSRKLTGYTKIVSSKPSILKIVKSGSGWIAKPLKTGETVLRYYKKNKLVKKETILVTDQSSFSFTTKQISLQKGKKLSVKCKAPSVCKVTYRTSNRKVVTVDQKGNAKAVGAGTALITATVTYRGKKLKVFQRKVTVTASEKKVTLKGLEITTTRKELTYGEELSKKDYTVKGVYSDGSKRKLTSWSAKAAYTSTTCTITFTSGSVKKSITLPVAQEEKEVLKKVTFALSSDSVYVGEKLKAGQLVVTAYYQSGGAVYKRNITDFSTDFSPKTIPGTYQITVVWGKSKGSLEIKVKERSNSATSYGASFGKSYLLFGEKPKMEDIMVIERHADGSETRYTDFTYDYQEAMKSGASGLLVLHIGDRDLKLQIPNYDPTDFRKLSVSTSQAVLTVGEELDRDAISVTAVNYAGQKVDVTKFSLDWTSKERPGTYPLTITAGGKSVTLDIMVE